MPRDLDEIDADLAEAHDDLKLLAPKVEGERLKVEKQAGKILAAERMWKTTHDSETPFDPDSFDPPLVPYTPDKKLQKDYHNIHYRIARLEKERAAAVRAEAGEY